MNKLPVVSVNELVVFEVIIDSVVSGETVVEIVDGLTVVVVCPGM